MGKNQKEKKTQARLEKNNESMKEEQKKETT